MTNKTIFVRNTTTGKIATILNGRTDWQTDGDTTRIFSPNRWGGSVDTANVADLEVVERDPFLTADAADFLPMPTMEDLGRAVNIVGDVSTDLSTVEVKAWATAELPGFRMPELRGFNSELSELGLQGRASVTSRVSYRGLPKDSPKRHERLQAAKEAARAKLPGLMAKAVADLLERAGNVITRHNEEVQSTWDSWIVSESAYTWTDTPTLAQATLAVAQLQAQLQAAQRVLADEKRQQAVETWEAADELPESLRQHAAELLADPEVFLGTRRGLPGLR